ncbi:MULTISPECIES: hypothetical protein [Bacillaceae]|uniref:Uncharacterized protein n=1 Tax=Evansella alkalicola TaxID=745819 RepID=A0ABS6JRQ0_9BACI|nr:MULTISPECIES: hypothetical protein [Bacillaceae]MBU9721234.1 hypothetical protein [Bacillus alkalicola]
MKIIKYILYALLIVLVGALLIFIDDSWIYYIKEVNPLLCFKKREASTYLIRWDKIPFMRKNTGNY